MRQQRQVQVVQVKRAGQIEVETLAAGEAAVADRAGGFTLTEVLVVTVIIGILIALVSAAVFPALDSAKEFASFSEAAKLKIAMEQLKSQYGGNATLLLGRAVIAPIGHAWDRA